jgi:hypothetical protein
MSLWFFLLAAVSSGFFVGWGLFMQVAAVVRQKRSFVGFVAKFLGLGPFFWALHAGRENLTLLIITFFISLAGFLVLLTLARDRLLR